MARVSLVDIENCGLSAAQTTLQAPGANLGTLGRTEFFTGIADEKNGPGFQSGLCSHPSEHKTTTSVCTTENPRLGTPPLCTTDWLPFQAAYWRGGLQLRHRPQILSWTAVWSKNEAARTPQGIPGLAF